MRIIRGRHRGKILIAPKHLPVRPTTDMAKEGLFNLMENYVDWHEIRALDLFAGTGNISFELVSRGCLDVIAVDANRECLKFIQKTAEQLGYEELKPIQFEAIHYLKKSIGKWDFIFADPPYDYEAYDSLVAMALDRLEDDGMFALEHGASIDLSEKPSFIEQRRYGSVHFSYFGKPKLPSVKSNEARQRSTALRR